MRNDLQVGDVVAKIVDSDTQRPSMHRSQKLDPLETVCVPMLQSIRKSYRWAYGSGWNVAHEWYNHKQSVDQSAQIAIVSEEKQNESTSAIFHTSSGFLAKDISLLNEATVSIKTKWRLRQK